MHMRAVVLLALLVAAPAHGEVAAPARAQSDPWAEVAFDRILGGKLDHLVVLGFNADGTRVAWVDSHVDDGSGFVRAEAALVDTSTGKVVKRHRIKPEHGPRDRALAAKRKPYDAFLGKLRGLGIASANVRRWDEKGDGFVGPDGTVTLALHAERDRSIAKATEYPAGARVHSLRLDDATTKEQAVLLEVYQGARDARSDPPTLTPVLGSASGDAFAVVVTTVGHVGCWSDRDSRIYVSTLARVRASKPVRDLIREGMDAYRAGDFREAQRSFRAAVALEPYAPRPLYDLAAVSARLHDDHEAVRMLERVARIDPDLLKAKVVTDPDFAEARRRHAYARFVDPAELDAFSAPDAAGLRTRLAVYKVGPSPQPVELELYVNNTGPRPAAFCRYFTPFEVMQGSFLEVAEENGRAIPYRGPAVRRAGPGPDDEQHVGAGETSHARFDLRDGYVLLPGRYQVRFVGAPITRLPASRVVTVVVPEPE